MACDEPEPEPDLHKNYIETSWGYVNGSIITKKLLRFNIMPFYDNSITYLDDKSINYKRHYKPFEGCVIEDDLTGIFNFVFRSNSLYSPPLAISRIESGN